MIVLEGKHGLDSWRYSSHLLVSLKVRPDLPVFFIADPTDFSDVVSVSKQPSCLALEVCLLVTSRIRREKFRQSMRTITLRNNVIATLALTVFFSVCAPSSAIAAKEAFTRTKPHVNVGTIGGEPAEIWFHANVGVFEDGNASGIIEARVIGGESFLYRAVEGEAIIDQGTVVELTLTLERVGEDGTPTGETDQVIVRHSPTREDCLIYDLVGPNIHLEAEGILDFTHNHRHP